MRSEEWEVRLEAVVICTSTEKELFCILEKTHSSSISITNFSSESDNIRIFVLLK